jgi:putative Holliday junction resolvase
MKETNILAFDIGIKKIGIARCYSDFGIPSPLTTIKNDENVFSVIEDIIKEESANLLVIGIPRNLKGEFTGQTEYTRDFISKLNDRFDLPIVEQDESLTTKKAEEELSTKKNNKFDDDSLAATYILEDYLAQSRD